MHQDWRGRNRDRVNGYQAKRRARPEVAEGNRRRSKAWHRANPERSAESHRRWREENPEKWRENLRREKLKRRRRQAGILLAVQVESSTCGVCFRPLTDEPSPHPLSTTVGHEPPLAVAELDGWLVVAERPEHRACNQRKNKRDDASYNEKSPAEAGLSLSALVALALT